jgi:hypothetical protein
MFSISPIPAPSPLRRPTRSWVRPLVALSALAVSLEPAVADALPIASYSLQGTFSVPTGVGPVDSTPDGRLVLLEGATIRLETAPGSRNFPVLATLPGANIPTFGPAFITVSPDGTRVAVGNNGGTNFATYEVGVFTLSANPVGQWFSVNHFDGEWLDNRYVGLTAGDFVSPSIVTALDTQSPVPASPNNPVLVSNIGGGSGGIAVDPSGRLYTANGFTTMGPSLTGDIRAASAAAWQSALGGGPNVNFEASALRAIRLLSGYPLAFDADGNLAVGGGDSSGAGTTGFVGLVSAASLNAAISTGIPVNPADSSVVRRLDPDPAPNSLYSVTSNPARQELYVRSFGANSFFVYGAALTATVPLLTDSGPLVLGALLTLLGASVTGLRRRKAGPEKPQ